MGMALGTSVALQGTHEIFGVSVGFGLGAAKKESCRSFWKETILAMKYRSQSAYKMHRG